MMLFIASISLIIALSYLSGFKCIPACLLYLTPSLDITAPFMMLDVLQHIDKAFEGGHCFPTFALHNAPLFLSLSLVPVECCMSVMHNLQLCWDSFRANTQIFISQKHLLSGI